MHYSSSAGREASAKIGRAAQGLSPAVNRRIVSRMSDPACFIHLDLDGLWTLPACFGYQETDEFTCDTVFDVAIPRLLENLDACGIKATVFVVGRDLELESKRVQVRAIVAAGHRLANHGYAHDLALGTRSPEAMLEDIQRAQTAIANLTGAPPFGFRAPGYGATLAMLEACARAGLRYDGSLFPSPWGRLLRAAMRSLQSKTVTAASPRPDLALVYGSGEHGPTLLDPFQLRTVAGPLWRLPVAVSPTLRIPLQASLAIRLGAPRVLRALEGLARRGVAFTWLLHGMDFLGPEDLAGRLPNALARAYNTPAARRIEFITTVLRELRSIAPPQLSEDWLLHAPPNRPQ